MIRRRVFAAALTGALLLAVSACGGDDPGTTTGAAPLTATSAAAEPTEVAEPTEAAEPADDKTLCKEAGAVADEQKKAILTLVATTGGEVPPADFKAMLADMDKQLTEAAGSANSKVAKAMKGVAAQSAEAAAAADPVAATEKPAFEKATAKLNTVCKKVGVKVKF